MRCANCNHKLIQWTPEGLRIRLDGPMTVRKDDGIVEAKCFWCKSPVQLPLELKQEFVEEHYVIQNRSP